MEQVRRDHNFSKRKLIQAVAKKGNDILDVGCGFGGDLHKWDSCDVNITMCEPSLVSLNEAKRRATEMNIGVEFHHGDIFACPDKQYDIVCYNFSLQYIFETQDFLEKSLDEIKKRLKKGGLLIGCIPDSEQLKRHHPFIDEFHNTFVIDEYQDKVHVYLSDTPYYKNGPIAEPIADKEKLRMMLSKRGIELRQWEKLVFKRNAKKISKLYSQFIFVNV